MGKTYTLPREVRFAVLAADAVVFTIFDKRLWVRTVPVNIPRVFDHMRGFPGAMLQPTEAAEETLQRVLKTKGGIDPKKVHLEQLYTFSRIDRDPRGRVVAVAYLGLVPWEALTEGERTSGENAAAWVPLSLARRLAYDHDEILATALDRLRGKVEYTTIIQKILPPEFTLTEVELAIEIVLGHGIDKRNFRKKILHVGVLKDLGRMRSGGRHRPAKLYAFASKEVRAIETI